MATSFQLLLLCMALITWGHVNSFSIRHRKEGSTDLADALAILQRQRRRVDVDLLPSRGSLLDDESLTLQDVRDWLNGEAVAGDRADMTRWIPGFRDFKDLEPSDLGYDLTDDAVPQSHVKASPSEIEAIFESEDGQNPPPVKKTKEEMVNVKGDKNVGHKSQNSLSATRVTSQKRDSSSEVRALNSLTKEEVKILMKAVGKLQQQLSDDENGDDSDLIENNDISDIETPQEEAIVVPEPVSQEELKSVFEESEGPVTRETKIILEQRPGEKEPTLVEEQVVSEKLPEIQEDIGGEEVGNELTQALTNELASEMEAERENKAVEDAVAEAASEAAAELENESGDDIDDERQIGDEGEQLPLDIEAQKLAAKYWLLNGDKYFRQQNKGLKRTSKRATGLSVDRNYDPSSDDIPEPTFSIAHLGKGKNHANINLSWLSPSLKPFVRKIISLQDEVDKLRLEARLEDMENDALTDALNEATLAQMEGTVSDVEWSSLQQAIRLESALQDVKHSTSDNVGIDTKLDSGSSVRADDGGDDDDDEDEEDGDGQGSAAFSGEVMRRGEPWRRKRGPSGTRRPDDVVRNFQPDLDFPLAVYRKYDDDLMKEAIEKLLEQSYFLRRRPGDFDYDPTQVASLFLSDPDRCPAVRRYSSNCALADLYSVPVDFEARALCNLHEMCYACGNSLGVEHSQCDLVYRTAASSLCKEEDGCEAEAEMFLRAMKLKTRYITHVQPSCRTTCTAEFLGMF